MKKASKRLDVTTTKRPNGTHGYRVSDPIQSWCIGGFEGIGQYKSKASAQRAGTKRAKLIIERP